MGPDYNRIGNQVTEARLRWFWTCAKRRGSGRTGRRMLNKELPGKRKGGRTQRKFTTVAKEDMQKVAVTEECVKVRWRQMKIKKIQKGEWQKQRMTMKRTKTEKKAKKMKTKKEEDEGKEVDEKERACLKVKHKQYQITTWRIKCFGA